MNDLAWLPYVIAAIIVAIVAWFTFRTVPRDTKNPTRPPDPPG
jgi:hypothetical protein